jgi:hypothetical protein
MKRGKFFNFTIFGDELEVDELTRQTTLPHEIYRKGESTKSKILDHYYLQKTNRFVFKDIDQSETIISSFLKKNLDIIAGNLSILKPYIHNNNAKIELVVYSSKKNDYVRLTKGIIHDLDLIGVPISFIIWECE